MKVRFTTAARLQFDGALGFLAERSPVAAYRLSLRVQQACASLEQFPESGQVRFRSGIRVIKVQRYPYLLFYRIRSDSIEIVSVRHAARRPPKESDFP